MIDKSVLSKREQRLEKIVDEIRSTGTLEGIWILQNFADQEKKLYLEKLLGEVNVEEIKSTMFSETIALAGHRHEFVEGAIWLLNHLKQSNKE